MTDLTSKQRAHLRSLANHLKPVVHVGNDGVTPAVVRTVEEAFHNRELLKVKVLEGEVAETAEALAAEVEGAAVVQTIGKTVVIYRPDPDEPEIRLPGSPSG